MPKFPLPDTAPQKASANLSEFAGLFRTPPKNAGAQSAHKIRIQS